MAHPRNLRESSPLEAHERRAVQPLLTDLYQVTMAYAYWKSGKKDDQAAFELYFRKNPFNGEFTIFGGVEDCIHFIRNFRFSTVDITYLRAVLPQYAENEFFGYLESIDGSLIRLHSIDEGSVVFPRVPLMRVEGPLPIVQLLETILLNLVNYASLVATNAARFRLAAGEKIQLLEFGLRRAQGPDGGLSASRYCYMGGFDATSNVLAGKLFQIPVRGTQAHSYVSSFCGPEDVKLRTLQSRDGSYTVDAYSRSLEWRKKLTKVLGFVEEETNQGELAAFVCFAISFPCGFLCLVDTYDVLRSGVPNFCAVALVLSELGHRPLGVRVDSGDLAYLSRSCKDMFFKVADTFDMPDFKQLTIVASNDINEDTILSLNHQGHAITSFGIGTHLVTCQKQPALGCVYKLVQINSEPRIKLSEDINKVTIPSCKSVYRLYGQDGHALVDLMTRVDEPAPANGQRVLSRHPFEESKRAYVIPSKVETLLKLYWDRGELMQELLPLTQLRQRTLLSLRTLRSDHTRSLNPTPYKVSVSDELYTYMHRLWLESAPIGELA